jgi:predicted adenylyl cyclase CyaB
MGGNENQEIEVKFHLKDIESFEKQFKQKGGQLIQPSTYEINYRFDTLDLQLHRQSKILRLRKDITSKLTYKGPTSIKDGIRIREELEITVDDIHLATRILESLGYKIYQTYEKYRTVYSYKGIQIMLDILPIGSFVEIEGHDPGKIKEISLELGLRWDRSIIKGYLNIYHDLCEMKNIKEPDLVFRNSVFDEQDLEKVRIFPADSSI